jgi:uracil-DNA glycosylase family 4
MRKSLPLWEQWASRATPVEYAPGCVKCSRGESVDQHRALLAAQKATSRADVLVIVGEPTMEEQSRGQAFVSAIHRSVERETAKWAAIDGSMSFRLSYAIKCRGSGTPKEVLKSMEACREHVRWDIDTVKPKRIVAIGTYAVRSMVGQWVDTSRLRRAWTYVDGVPTFLVMDPALGLRNRFYNKAFLSSFQWALTQAVPAMPKGKTTVLTSRNEVVGFLRGLNRHLPVAMDVEHVGTLWSGDFRLLCFGLCQDPEAPVVITPEAVQDAKFELAKWLEDPTWPKVNQNIKHDRHAMFRVLGADTRGIVADTMLNSRLRDPEAPAGLGPQSWLVGFGGYKEAAKAISTAATDKDGEESKGGAMFGKMAPDDLHAYNGRDGAATILVHRWQQPYLARTRTTWNRLIGPAFDALAIVERNGMLVSPDNVRAYDAWLAAREDKAKAELYAHPMVPPTFNPGSPLQVCNLLYTQLGLPVLGRTKTKAPSAAAEILEQLKDKHPIVAVLLELASVRTQRSKYGLALLDHVSPIDGRIHTTFKLVRTLRLSSSDPNMQNVTTPEEPGDEGTWARGCFVAPKGHKFINLDFGQQELRVAAMLSGDMVMAKAFRQGHDYHTMTAAMIFNCKPDAVLKDQRRVAKQINFGLIYGQTSFGLAKALNISEKKAQGYIDTLFGKLIRLNDWRSKQIADARLTGEVLAVWNPPGGNLGWALTRAVWGIGEEGEGGEKIRKHNENVALNTPIQGLANCFTLASIIELVRWTQDERPEVKVVMTVHDSIVLEAPNNLVDEVVREARSVMTRWPSGVVGLHVDAEVGDTWGTMTKYCGV